MTTPPLKISLDKFAYRQFDDPTYVGTKLNMSKIELMKHVQSHYESHPILIEGYAPFCKHIFMPNLDPHIRDAAVQITPQNERLLCTAYQARKDDELPVLVRFFPRGSVEPPVSKFLDLILYSREQIEKEHAATGVVEELDDAPWRLIGIKGQSVPYEIPMNPITMMRNEMISQGGSGVAIDKEAYMKSVTYWKDHATVA